MLGQAWYDPKLELESSSFPGCSAVASAMPLCGGVYGWPPDKDGRLVIPSSVAFIGERAFQRCTGLTSVTIPSSVTSIGHEAFEGCTGLTSGFFSSGVTSIGAGAFRTCTRLAEVNLPDTIQAIGNDAFAGCPAIKVVTVDGWRSFPPFSRHFKTIFVNVDDVEVVDAPNSFVRQLGGVCKGIAKYNDLPVEVRVRALRVSFWSVKTHLSRCTAGKRMFAWTLLLVGEALQREKAELPDLPPELWLHIMSFIPLVAIGC